MDLLTWAGGAFAALIPLANPLNAVPLFAVMTSDLSDQERKRLATKAGLYTGAILLVTALAGAFILDFFGINLATLEIAGGLIVGSAAWAMVTGNPQVSQTETATWAREKRFSLRDVPRMVARSIETRDVSQLRPQHHQHEADPADAAPLAPTPVDSPDPAGPDPADPDPADPDGASADGTSPADNQDAESSPSARAQGIAFSPIAMPLLAGPAAMGMVIGLTSRTDTLAGDIGVLVGIGLITIVAIIGLRATGPILHALGASGILAFQRIFGFILLAIAVTLVTNGISGVFGIPIATG